MKDKWNELGETSGTHMQEPEAKSKDGGKATKEDVVQSEDQKAAPTREYIGAVVDNTEDLDDFTLILDNKRNPEVEPEQATEDPPISGLRGSVGP
ncbi:hypothetical protein L1987_06215 [Smallanthus sonchifolius]|uniref:Uncharacterized protein n=1 Tax=Smallanthus sonchifolius TaxID=185202 RepID=A0ACB9JXH4_9ASTR|nr:hypothetical protein L1987_06215 [Smallanthus sonchifolius]